MVSVTRRAISSLRSCGWPLRMRMFTNGMASPPCSWAYSASSLLRSAASSLSWAAGPEKRTAPFSRTYTRSASESEKSTPCSASRIVSPRASARRCARAASSTISGRQALGGLVEQQQLGVAHQRAGDRQHLLLAARQERRPCGSRSSASLGNSSHTVSTVHGPERSADAARRRRGSPRRSARRRCGGPPARSRCRSRATRWAPQPVIVLALETHLALRRAASAP